MAAKRRPWYRLRNVVLSAAVAFLCLAGWALWETLSVYGGAPRPSIDYGARLRALAAETSGADAPDGEAAWGLLLETLELSRRVLAEVDAEIVAEGQETADPEAWTDFGRITHFDVMPDVSAEKRAITRLRQAGVFERMRRLVAGPVPLMPEVASDVPLFMVIQQVLFPPLAPARGFAQARAASMRLAFRAGDEAESAAAFEEVMGLARALSYQPALLSYLTAMAIRSLALYELREDLMEHTPGEDLCRVLLGALERQALAPLALSLRAEQLYFEDCIQRMYSDDGRGSGYLVCAPDPQTGAPGSPSFLGAFAGRFFHPSRAEVMQASELAFSELIARADAAPARRVASDLDPESLLERLPALVGGAMAALVYPLGIAARQGTIAQGTRLMVALDLYRARHGAYPQRLEELVPAILPRLSQDPINGGDFGYRRLESDPSLRPYLLYSTGLDGTDDGGVEAAGADRWGALAPGHSGTDYQINRSRRDEVFPDPPPS
jgi:hypothetical protein